MTWLTIAKSVQEAAFVELYTFVRGSETWRYCSAAYDITYGGFIYVASSVKRGKTKQTDDMFKSTLEFTFPLSSSFAIYYIRYPSVQVTSVSVMRGFGSGEFVNWWSGRIIGGRVSKNEITIECEPIFTSMKRPGLRKVYEVTCRHVLYEGECRVDRSAFARFVEITDITGNVVTVNNMVGVDANWFNGGMIVSLSLKRYYIAKHVGSELSIFLNPELAVGDSITIYPGCDFIFATCKDKFDNGINFGGFPWMPDVNYYEGISIGN